MKRINFVLTIALLLSGCSGLGQKAFQFPKSCGEFNSYTAEQKSLLASNMNTNKRAYYTDQGAWALEPMQSFEKVCSNAPPELDPLADMNDHHTAVCSKFVSLPDAVKAEWVSAALLGDPSAKQQGLVPSVAAACRVFESDNRELGFALEDVKRYGMLLLSWSQESRLGFETKVWMFALPVQKDPAVAHPLGEDEGTPATGCSFSADLDAAIPVTVAVRSASSADSDKPFSIAWNLSRSRPGLSSVEIGFTSQKCFPPNDSGVVTVQTQWGNERRDETYKGGSFIILHNYYAPANTANSANAADLDNLKITSVAPKGVDDMILGYDEVSATLKGLG